MRITLVATVVVCVAAVLGGGCIAYPVGPGAGMGGDEPLAIRAVAYGDVVGLGVDPRPGMWARTKAAFKNAPIRSSAAVLAVAGAGYFAYDAWASEQEDRHHSNTDQKSGSGRGGVSANVQNSSDVEIYIIQGDSNGDNGKDQSTGE